MRRIVFFDKLVGFLFARSHVHNNTEALGKVFDHPVIEFPYHRNIELLEFVISDQAQL